MNFMLEFFFNLLELEKILMTKTKIIVYLELTQNRN